MEMKDILVRPIVTEKSTTSLPDNTFAFEVGLKANKVQMPPPKPHSHTRPRRTRPPIP